MTWDEYDALSDIEGERALEREFEDAMAKPSAAPSLAVLLEDAAPSPTTPTDSVCTAPAGDEHINIGLDNPTESTPLKRKP
jgi:hypothetical protein